MSSKSVDEQTDRGVAWGGDGAQDAIRSSVRLAPTKRCVPEFPAIRARSGARLPYLCDPAAFGASEPTGSCTRPPLAPGARRRPEGQYYGYFWGPAQAAGPQRARGKNGHALAQEMVEKPSAASISCISARCTPSGLVDS